MSVETLDHPFKQRLTASVLCLSALATAACTSNEEAPAGPESSNTHYADLATKKLDPIQGFKWHKSSVKESGVIMTDTGPVAEAYPDYSEDDGVTIYQHKKMPSPYQEALQVALSEPIVRLATDTTVSSYVVKTAEKGQDNGYYDPSTKEVLFEISDGTKEPRIYDSQLSFSAVAIHEAVHALSEDWYGTIGKRKPADNQLTDVLNACTTMRDEVFRDYVDTNRQQLADAFSKTAGALQRAIDTGEVSYYEVSSADATKIEGYIKALRITASAIEMKDDRVFEVLDLSTKTCDFVDMFSIAYPFAENGMGAYAEYFETAPLHVQNFEQNKEVDLAYACVKDARAVADIQPDHTTKAGGHSYDNPTEMASSLITSLEVNPEYVLKCMNELEAENPDRAQNLWKLIGAIWMISVHHNPGLEELIKDEPAAREVVSHSLKSNK